MAAETQVNGFGLRYPTPTSFVVDREGVVRLRHRGAKMPPFYREHLLPLLRPAER
jgi:hypothetical protein